MADDVGVLTAVWYSHALWIRPQVCSLQSLRGAFCKADCGKIRASTLSFKTDLSVIVGRSETMYSIEQGKSRRDDLGGELRRIRCFHWLAS
jgi:hypothetical protein